MIEEDIFKAVTKKSQKQDYKDATKGATKNYFNKIMSSPLNNLQYQDSENASSEDLSTKRDNTMKLEPQLRVNMYMKYYDDFDKERD